MKPKLFIVLTLLIVFTLILYDSGDLGIGGTNNKYADYFYSFARSQASNTDITQLIARAVNGESRGEPYTGQVAVASVILNRVDDARFPNTIPGVIYQPGAFTAVQDGQINAYLDPNSTVVKATKDALNGWDPTYGCVYYFNPATATSKWIWSRQIVTTIGRHKFAK